MENLNNQMHLVWNAELEILDVIDAVCQKYNLRYSLAYGTLLGAVRHGGFIPWDDDIDLIMPREDYEKLCSIWHEVAPEEYILQNKRTDPDFTQNFTKIRKDHTTFLQEEFERKKKYHKGFFVDIFPGDRVAPGGVSRKIQYAFSAVNLLYTRGFTSGSTGIVGRVEHIMIHFPMCFQQRLLQLSEKVIRHWNSRSDLPYFFPSTIIDAGKSYPSDLFDTVGTISYCEKQYCTVSDPDRLLRLNYGDYMQLPPEEERVWKHHPLIIDFHHNYEELDL